MHIISNIHTIIHHIATPAYKYYQCLDSHMLIVDSIILIHGMSIDDSYLLFTYRIILYYIILYYIMLYYIILYYIILHYIILYYIILYYIRLD